MGASDTHSKSKAMSVDYVELFYYLVLMGLICCLITQILQRPVFVFVSVLIEAAKLFEFVFM